LIVSRVGVGKLTVASCELCTSQDYTNFVPSKDRVLYLAYWMVANTNALLRLCQGTSIKGLTSEDLKTLRVPIPHPDEQQKIAEALSAMDAKIQAVAGQIEKMGAFKTGLLQQMFV
jgi:type I restriction enzyme S subunit